jgi:hypothetical protein
LTSCSWVGTPSLVRTAEAEVVAVACWEVGGLEVVAAAMGVAKEGRTGPVGEALDLEAVQLAVDTAGKAAAEVQLEVQLVADWVESWAKGEHGAHGDQVVEALE